MGSTVAAKANHYQVLGLTPAASESQIARAFADAMSMFRVRPAAALADIGVAYETLRNPAKPSRVATNWPPPGGHLPE